MNNVMNNSYLLLNQRNGCIQSPRKLQILQDVIFSNEIMSIPNFMKIRRSFKKLLEENIRGFGLHESKAIFHCRG
jgi:hypothetical protein